MTPGPFAQLVALADRAPVRTMQSPARPGASRVDRLVTVIECSGPLSTAHLAIISGFNSHLVWGLLKARRAAGQVVHRDGLWSLNPDYRSEDEAEVAAAARLLRSRGWRVHEPARER